MVRVEEKEGEEDRLSRTTRMRKSKTPKRIFFISLSRPNGDATKEKSALQLISKTFRCSRVAIASVPGKHTDVSYFYVLIELNPGLL